MYLKQCYDVVFFLYFDTWTTNPNDVALTCFYQTLFYRQLTN